MFPVWEKSRFPSYTIAFFKLEGAPTWAVPGFLIFTIEETAGSNYVESKIEQKFPESNCDMVSSGIERCKNFIIMLGEEKWSHTTNFDF